MFWIGFAVGVFATAVVAATAFYFWARDVFRDFWTHS
jgi:hypothetical protein